MLSFAVKPQVSFRLLAFTALISIGIAGIIGSNEGTSPGISTSNPSDVVYFLADKDTAGTKELYVYSLGTGQITKLNEPLVSEGNVVNYSISPDGTLVAYVADQETDDRFELYVAKPDGSLVTKVSNSTVNSNSDVEGNPLWAPDSSRIAYRSNESVRGIDVFVLRTVRPDGTGNVIVNPEEASGGSVEQTSFAWAPDASRIAYLADQSSVDVIELYTSPATSASGNAKVNGSLATNGNVTGYAWAPDSALIAYRADQFQDEVYELWVSTPTGGNNIRLNRPFNGPNMDVQDLSIVWAPDSSRIAYISNETSEQNFRLYTALPSGAGQLQVSTNATHDFGNVIGIPAWSPTNEYIAYLGDLNTDQQFELYVSTPTVAASSNKVSGMLQGGNVQTGPELGSPPAWSPDGSGIAYIAQQDSSVLDEVYVGTANGTNVKVSATPAMATVVSLGMAAEVWAPDGERLLYKSNQLDGSTLELFTTLATGNTSIARITRTPVLADSLKSFGKWAPDGAYIAYVSEQDTVDVDELYINTPNDSNNHKISGSLTIGGNVDSEWFEWGR